VARCPGDSSEGLPSFSLDCVGDICQSLFRPKPCSFDTDCATGLKCTDILSPDLFDTGISDFVGELVWGQAAGFCSPEGDLQHVIPTDIVPCSNTKTGARIIENAIRYMGGNGRATTEPNGEVKFCFVDLTIAKNAEHQQQWIDAQIKVTDTSTGVSVVDINIGPIADTSSPDVTLTLDTSCDGFDAVAFVTTLATELDLDPSTISVSDVKCVDGKPVVTLTLSASVGLSPADADAEVRAKIATIQANAAAGMVGGYGVKKFDVGAWPTPPPPAAPAAEKKSTLGGGPIAGIVIAGVVFIVIVLAVVGFVMMRRKPKAPGMESGSSGKSAKAVSEKANPTTDEEMESNDEMESSAA